MESLVGVFSKSAKDLANINKKYLDYSKGRINVNDK